MSKRRPLSALTSASSDAKLNDDTAEQKAFVDAAKQKNSKAKSGLQALKQNSKNRGAAKSIYLSQKAVEQLDAILEATGANTSQIICQALDEFYERVKNEIV